MRHFLSLLDLGSEGLRKVLSESHRMKRLRGQTGQPMPLRGKSLGILMEKASTRTRISFEVGVHELGGQPISLAGRDLQISRDEPLEDTARVLSRYVHGVILRTHAHERLTTIANASTVPFVNALTDRYHPCQLLADLMTIEEHRGDGLSGLVVAWVGDGNNMAHSWILASALLGFELRIACPEGYKPDSSVLAEVESLGGSRLVGHDPAEVVAGAHVVTTDVWASMGQEHERAARTKAFTGFCVTDDLMARAADDARFLHCLPAHRGEEVAATVIDGPQSVVWDEAENRLHAQKALL
ncbi:MAG: ornithine carbamoyltransferase, partial [Myxococcales bacterium]|nr:ornithine carbamoyltransferase [Myxococcales bacterium]MDD9967997.1 ornithine carbamoyltransferase [Myxococcales bacterium]